MSYCFFPSCFHGWGDFLALKCVLHTPVRFSDNHFLSLYERTMRIGGDLCQITIFARWIDGQIIRCGSNFEPFVFIRPFLRPHRYLSIEGTAIIAVPLSPMPSSRNGGPFAFWLCFAFYIHNYNSAPLLAFPRDFFGLELSPCRNSSRRQSELLFAY